jgi:hypothetical protein
MSSRTETYRAKWESPFPTSFTKAERIDTRKLLTKSILSRFEPDLAGDIVNPAGIDWSLHQTDPWIDLEHGRDADVGDKPVAWAFERPGAPYAVEYKSLNFAGPGESDRWEKVPIGTEYFDPKSKLSMQIFAMRDQDALPCSSLEFLPIRGHFKAIGRTTMEPRPCMPDPYAAYQFDRCRVVRWTICAKGVCPHAMTLTKSTGGNSQVPSTLEKILTDKCVNINGIREPLHEYILKALAPGHTKRTTVTVERKAMSPDYAATAAPTTDAPLETESAQAVDQMAPAEPGPTPTAQDAYDAAQALSDLCEQIKAGASRREHKPGRKKLAAICDKLQTISEMAMAVGRQVDADLSDDGELDGSGSEEEDAEVEEGGEEKDTEDDDTEDEKQEKAFRKALAQLTPEDLTRGEDGVLNGIPTTIKKSVKRFTFRDLSTAPQPTAEVQKATEVEVEETPEEALARIKTEEPEQYAAFQRELNLINTCR